MVSTDDSSRVANDDASDEASDLKRDTLSNFEVEILKKELQFELNELENEFRLTKELLFNERSSQVDIKLQQSKSGTAPEFLEVAALVEEAHKLRKEVARSRRDFALEVANKELDIESQTATCDAKEHLRSFEESMRAKLKEKLCKLMVDNYVRRKRKKKKVARNKKPFHEKKVKANEDLSDDEIYSVVDILSNDEMDEFDNIYIPNLNLDRRRSPIAISPDQPHMVYHLNDDDINMDLASIVDAIKEQKVQMAIASKYPLLG